MGSEGAPFMRHVEVVNGVLGRRGNDTNYRVVSEVVLIVPTSVVTPSVFRGWRWVAHAFCYKQLFIEDFFL